MLQADMKGHSSRGLEGRDAERNVVSEGLVQDFPEWNNIGSWFSGHSCDILTKNIVIFCPCHENLPEATLKRNALISLPEQF